MSEQGSERVGGDGAGPAACGGHDAEPEAQPAAAVGYALRDRILDWIEAGLWLALLGAGSLVALAMLHIDSPLDRAGWTRVIAPDGVIEAEDMKVRAKSREFTYWLQPTSAFPGGGWSKDGHMFAFGTVKGDWIELELPELDSGLYEVELFLTKARDYGILTASLNDVPVGEFDLWSGRGVVPTGALDLGEIELAGHGDVLRLEIGGPNPRAASPFFQFGFDGIRVEAVEDDDDELWDVVTQSEPDSAAPGP